MRPIFCWILPALFLVASCGNNSNQPGYVVAKGQHPDYPFNITRGELNGHLTEFHPGFQDLDAQELRTLELGALNELALRKVLDMEISKQGLSQAVERKASSSFEAFTKRFPDKEKLERFYKSNRLTQDTLMSKLYFQAAAEALEESLGKQSQDPTVSTPTGAAPSPVEIEGANIQVLEIALFKSKLGDIEDLRKEMSQLHEKIVQGKLDPEASGPSSSLSSRYPMHITRKKLAPQTSPPSVKEAVFELKVNEWSPLLETAHGLFLYKRLPESSSGTTQQGVSTTRPEETSLNRLLAHLKDKTQMEIRLPDISQTTSP